MRRIVIFVTLVVVALAGLAEKLPPLPDGAFTYVVIPDTQLYRGSGTYEERLVCGRVRWLRGS